MTFENNLIERAKQANKKIVFAEAMFSERVCLACEKLCRDDIVKCVLVGNKEEISKKHPALANCEFFDNQNAELKNELAKKYYEIRKAKGETKQQCLQEMEQNVYAFAAMLVVCGYADGSVGGAECSTANFLSPALKVLKNPNGKSVNSFMIMSGENSYTDSQFVLADCGLMENPTAEQMALIAENCVNIYKKITNFEPRVAFLSYSTYGSAASEVVEKSLTAYKMFKANNPCVKAVGEVQLDAALKEDVAKHKIKCEADFYGRANIFVFPDLQSANICYKAINMFGNIKTIGPATSNFLKPVNDLSRGCNVDEIVLLAALTAVQC